MSFPPKTDPEKACQTCGIPLVRKRFASGRLEDRNVFLRRLYCSLSCANSKTVVTKDAQHWRARKYKGQQCETCGTTHRLHVHHKDRDHTNNDPSNLATLCASCHLKLHWREDRDKRIAAVWRGVSTRQRSTAGSKS